MGLRQEFHTPAEAAGLYEEGKRSETTLPPHLSGTAQFLDAGLQSDMD